MEDRLVPLNAVIALYSATKTSWPRPFFDAGYRLEGLELPIRLPDDGKVVADAVGFNRNSNSFVLHESKSGANVDMDQAKRYAQSEATYLVTALSVTIGSRVPLTVETTYVCLREHEGRILMGLKEAKLEAPLLSVGPLDIATAGATFKDPVLRGMFDNPIQVPGEPPGVVALDLDSPDEAFDNAVFPSLIAAMSQERQNISMAALAEDALPYFAIYPAAYKQRLKRRVAGAVQRAAQADPQHLEYRPPTNAEPDGMVRILGTPEQSDPRGRTQQYQSIHSRLEGGRRRSRKPEIKGQGNLFRSVDLEQELEKAKTESDEREEEE